MKEHPIIFSAPMVRAILDGEKTQTRRMCKMVGHWSTPPARYVDGYLNRAGIDPSERILCPYGVPDDRLWVRETFGMVFNQDDCIEDAASKGPSNCRMDGGTCDGCHVEYRADTDNPLPGCWPTDMRDDPDCPRWRPSIHMPRWASRITLEVTRVRVERVQEISEDDAKAEGVIARPLDDLGGTWKTYRHGFLALWNSINAKRGHGWDVNPWVWCISFRMVS